MDCVTAKQQGSCDRKGSGFTKAMPDSTGIVPHGKQGSEQQPLLKGLHSTYNRAILESGRQKILEPGTILFREGDPARDCYLVLSGSLKLVRLTSKGKEIIIRYIGVSEMAAALVIMKKQPYPATGQAIKPTQIITWRKDAFIDLLYSHPAIAMNILDMVIDRLDDVQHRFFELSSEMVEQRINKTLLRLSGKAGRKVGGGIYIDMPLSRQDVADYCGTTVYTVSRMLKVWERHGLIQCRRERVLIVALQSIENIAQSA